MSLSLEAISQYKLEIASISMLTLKSSAEGEFQLYLLTTAINCLSMWFQPIASWLIMCITNHGLLIYIIILLLLLIIIITQHLWKMNENDWGILSACKSRLLTTLQLLQKMNDIVVRETSSSEWRNLSTWAENSMKEVAQTRCPKKNWLRLWCIKAF